MMKIFQQLQDDFWIPNELDDSISDPQNVLCNKIIVNVPKWYIRSSGKCYCIHRFFLLLSRYIRASEKLFHGCIKVKSFQMAYIKILSVAFSIYICEREEEFSKKLEFPIPTTRSCHIDVIQSINCAIKLWCNLTAFYIELKSMA